MDLKTIKSALEELAEQKGISHEKIRETIEMALAAAYKRDYGKRGQIVRAKFDINTGEIAFTQIKVVVDESMIKSEEEIAAEETSKETGKQETEFLLSEEIGEELKKVRFNPDRHIMIEEAKKIKKKILPRDELEFALETQKDYGRIAAQTAKQVIMQRIREAEREAIYGEFKEKQGEIVSGIVQRIEGKNVYLDLGKATAVLPFEEQIPHEHYRAGERVKALLLLTEKSTHGPGIYLSRSHPRFVLKLFELEVPEIKQGSVEIKGIAREPGSRSKIAAISHEEGVDPVGSLVGQKGVRVGTVISELGGEKIDIAEWSEDPERFIANVLSPAKVLSVDAISARKEAVALVDESQLSLAIGRGGQNVRLAVKLTGWRIDVRSNTSTSKKIKSDEQQDIKE